MTRTPRRTVCSSSSTGPTSSISPSAGPTGTRSRRCSPTPATTSGYVRVRDRYGDYGICGFYSVARHEGALVDFLFSCRVLNMGVEQWLYEKLGRPGHLGGGGDRLHARGIRRLDHRGREADAARRRSGGQEHDPNRAPSQPNRILMVGGCDLTATAEFLGGQHLHRSRPRGTDGRLRPRGAHRAAPAVSERPLARPAGAGRPDPLPRPAGVQLAGRRRSRLRRARLQRADRLHPGDLPAPGARTRRALASVPPRCDRSRIQAAAGGQVQP